MNTCTMPECAKPHRAKGLCSTHYNNTYQKDRHAKVQVPCAYCGTPVAKAKSNNSTRRPTCSDQCRSDIARPPKCNLPADHWALWYGKTSEWPRCPLIQCTVCDTTIAPASPTRTCCSDTCIRTKELHDAGRMPQREWATVPRQCATCGCTYTSPYVGQSSCNTCRRAKQRSHWINDRRRIALYKRDKYKCHICGDKTDAKAHYLDATYPTLDHLVPRSKGGSDEDYNLSTCCRGCNSLRGADELPMLQLA